MLKRFNLILTAIIFICVSCTRTNDYTRLQSQIEHLISDKDATIGVSIIIDGIDTISVNGDRPFPMLSVYKFPIALALGDYARCGALLIPDSILITKNDLKDNTYSPMRERYANVDSIKLPLEEILAYSLQKSDNNASDIILSLLPSVNYATHCLQRNGINDIIVSATEAEMHKDISLSYTNTSTPLAMATLLSRFDRDFTDHYSLTIKQLMESCTTGQNRLAKPLMQSNILIGHKTGTGFELPNGRLMAINDVGYIHLPTGHCYSIAVFIENSGYNIDATETIIAQISKTAYNFISNLPSSDKH